MPDGTAVGAACVPERPERPWVSGALPAYRGPVAGGSRSTEGLRTRMARDRPNWWVILAVTLALMALLVAIASGTPRRTPGSHVLAAPSGPAGRQSGQAAHRAPKPAAAATTSTSTTLPGMPPASSPVTEAGSSSSALTTNHLAHSGS